MRDWKQALIPPSATVRDAVRAIDGSGIQIALVVDPNRILLGTVTDGDVRRALLKGIALEDAASKVMNTRPTVVGEHDSDQRILALMKKTLLRCIPVTADSGEIKRVALLSDLIQSREKDNLVLIMAGGVGSRLTPLTDNCPKPLLKVGTKPLLETIVEGLRDHGFRNFFFSVNYKAEMVKEHFGDGEQLGVSIRYLEENKRLGTAGALSLLPEQPEKPVLVMNGDLLTKVNFEQLLDFHCDQRAVATMCVREYDIQIPFGVVRIEDHRLKNVDEKPMQRFFVNAGIYVLEPEVIGGIPRDTYFDMTTMFEQLVKQGRETAVFPIREYWLDIGQLEDLERARVEYGGLFQ